MRKLVLALLLTAPGCTSPAPPVVAPPDVMSPTKPLQLPLHSTRSSVATLVKPSAPPKLMVKPVSVTPLTLTVAPAGQPAMASIASRPMRARSRRTSCEGSPSSPR